MPPEIGARIRNPAGALVVDLGAHALAKHPDIAARIGQLAAEWAQAEAELGSSLATLMRTSPERTFALLKAYKSASTTADAARDLARATLEEPQLSEFEKIIIQFKNLASERNKVQHAVWANKPGEDDYVFRVEALEYTKFWANIHDAQDKVAVAEAFASSLNDKYGPARLDELNRKLRQLAADIMSAKLSWRGQVTAG